MKYRPEKETVKSDKDYILEIMDYKGMPAVEYDLMSKKDLDKISRLLSQIWALVHAHKIR